METPIEEKTIKIRKDAIKNIAIIFLAIMLVLTFFSNSIMNKSLPEVAVKYVENGNISEKIRGTGTVETDDPYSVIVTDSRKISGVAVQVGDDVEKDQVLFYLDGSESEELEKAEAELEDLIYNYTTGALTGDMSASAYQQATSGQVSSMAVYEARIEAAKARVNAAQDKVDSIIRQQTIADGTSDVGYTTELNQVEADLKEVQEQLADAEKVYSELAAIVDAGQGNAQNANYAALEEANAKNAYETEQKKALDAIDDDWAATLGNLVIANSGKYSSIASPDDLKALIFDKANMIKDPEALNDWVNAYGGSYGTTELDKLTAAYKDYVEKQVASQQAASDSKEYSDAKNRLAGAKSKVDGLKNKQNELQTQITKINNDKEANAAGNKQLANNLALNKADADKELADAQEDLKQLLVDISKTLDLSNQNSIIKDQKEKIEKLKEQAMGSTVTAPVAGKILSIGKTSGETTTPAEPLATIQVAGKPKTLKVSVTDEQAKKVSPGQEAELQNSWYYSDIRVRLSKILQDPESKGKKKILVFNVDGDVVDGASLSISIGQRSGDYDKVVPNSAVREDNKGKFVLIIEEKGTPFGTRYKAKRVDVDVLATDDNFSAISGEIESWAYVITTSDKPVSAGQQVRLSNN